MDVAEGVGSTVVPVSLFVSASEGDDPDLDFSSNCSASSNEGEGSFERTGEADMEVERREAHSGFAGA